MRGSEPTDRRQSGQGACEATWQTTTTTGSAQVERSTVPMSGRSNLGHPSYIPPRPDVRSRAANVRVTSDAGGHTWSYFAYEDRDFGT